MSETAKDILQKYECMDLKDQMLTLKNKLLDQAGLLRALEDKETQLHTLESQLSMVKTEYAETLAAHEEGPVSLARVNRQIQQAQVELDSLRALNEQLREKVAQNHVPQTLIEIQALQEQISARDKTISEFRSTLVSSRNDHLEGGEREVALRSSVDKALATSPAVHRLAKAKRVTEHLRNVLKESRKQLSRTRDVLKCYRTEARRDWILRKDAE